MSYARGDSVVGGADRRRTVLKKIEENGANTSVAIQSLQKDITKEAVAQELWRQKDKEKQIGEEAILCQFDLW